MDYPRQRLTRPSCIRGYVKHSLPSVIAGLVIAIIVYFWLALLEDAMKVMRMPQIGKEHKIAICLTISVVSVIGCELYELLLRAKGKQ